MKIFPWRPDVKIEDIDFRVALISNVEIILMTPKINEWSLINIHTDS